MKPLSVIAMLSLLAGSAQSQELAPAAPALPQISQVRDVAAIPADTARINPRASNRWLVLICGLSGDDEHRERLTDAMKQIGAAAKPVLHVDGSRLNVLAGDETMATAMKSEVTEAQVCTRDSVAACLQELGKRIQPTDSCWVILLGHAQFYNGRSTFNVFGPDFDAKEFATWMKPIQCEERVYFFTMPVSGSWLKSVRGPRTVSISATDGDYEFTGTEMPYALARVVSNKPETQALDDIDKDGTISLFDLYLAVNLEIHGRFKSMERLQTEHALLDDNGDGLGKELQTPYMPVEAELGGSAKRLHKRQLKTTNTDGDYSKRIIIGRPSEVGR